MVVPFYEHDISHLEIERVVEVLKSGWVSTGPEVARFNRDLRSFLHSPKIIFTSSAWSGLFLTLKSWGIAKGDEIITTPYTFSATANAIVQNEARVVFADVGADYLIDPAEIARKITTKTKAIITMDYGGYPCNYAKIHKIVGEQKQKFIANNPQQEKLGRIAIIGDGAHSFGTMPKRENENLLPDIYVYSFHAVKNITTVDGGAISLLNQEISENHSFSDHLHSLVLHGMTSNAYERLGKKNMFYDISSAGYKVNLNDINAAIGRMQLKRIDHFFQQKTELLHYYNEMFQNDANYLSRNNLSNDDYEIFPHLYTLELTGEEFDHLDKKKDFLLAVRDRGVALNMHYLPLPLTSLYKKMGFAMSDYPQAHFLAKRHFSLPFYSKLGLERAAFVGETLRQFFK